jgi:hypothetical protein
MTGAVELLRAWFKPVCYFAGLMCLLSLLPLPMASLAVVARFVAFAASVIAVFAAWNRGSLLAVALFLGMVILFNPIAPILLERPYWIGATVFAALVFFLAGVRLLPASDTVPRDEI